MKRAETESSGRRPHIECCLKVPDLDLAVISPGNDALVVESNAADELLVAFEDTQTDAGNDVPQSGKVRYYSPSISRFQSLQILSLALFILRARAVEQREDNHLWNTGLFFYETRLYVDPLGQLFSRTD